MTATEDASTSVHKDTTLQTPFRHSDTLSLAVLLALSCCLFSNGLYGEFVFDDGAALGNNNDTKSDLTPLKDVFLNDFWGTPVRDVRSHRSYRPTVILTFRLQHYLMGYRHDATSLHVVNYIMAYINVCLVYYLARLYMKPHVDSADGVADRPLHVAWRRCAIPFAAALLFLAHPVHVDSVTSIVGRCELMCCFFGLCALFVEHAYLCVWGRGWHVHVGCVLLSTVLMILSVTSKDSGIAYCGVFVVHAVGIYCWKRGSLRRTIMCVILSVAQVVGYFGFRMYALGALSLRVKDLRRTETPQYFVPPGVWHWLAIRWVVAMKNLELLFFPTKLAHEYAYNCVAHLETLSDERLPVFCAVTLVVLCYVCALVYRVLRHRSRGAGMQLMAVLWAVVLYAPVSHFFVTVGTFIAERCLYSSSVGVVLLLAYVFVPAEFPNTRLRWAGCAALCALVLIWMVVSHRRIPDWDNPEALCTGGLQTCPNSGKMMFCVATSKKGRTGMTEDVFQLMVTAYGVDNAMNDELYDIGMYLWNKGDFMEGYTYIRKCCMGFKERCMDAYTKLREKLFPDMDKASQALDYTTVVYRSDAKATYYMDAARVLMARKNFCHALRLTNSAMAAWREVKVWWVSVFNDQIPLTDTFCGSFALQVTSLWKCLEDSEDEEDATQMVSDGIASLLDAVRQCHTSKAPPDQFSRLNRAKTLALNFTHHLDVSTQALDNIVPLLDDFDQQLEVRTAALELQLRRYCHTSAVLKDVALLQLLPESSIPAVAVLRDEFTAHHVEWRASIVHAMSELNRIGADIAWTTEDEMFQCVKYY